MRKEQSAALRDLLLAVIPRDRLPATEIDALVAYMSEVANSEDEAVQRISGILNRDVGASMMLQNALQVELLREKTSEIQHRLRELELTSRSDGQKLHMVQAIFIAISFISGSVALLKAFGLLKLPW